ncbi:MAG TPA: YbhN family protein [Streptosporangiaceae bacterium]
MRTGTGGSGPMVNDGPGADRGGPEDPANAGASGQSADGGTSGGSPSRWSRWRGWRPWVKPVRRVVLLFVLALVVEYLVVPELVGARKDLYLLNQVNGGWAAAGLVLEGVSLFCYAVLTKVLLPPGPKPSLSRLFRIDLSAAAVAHVIPAGTLGTAALGFRLFTNEGISANDAGVMMAAKGLGSTIVLNVLLWLSLVISIPLAGFRPIYGTVAIIGTVLLAAVALVIVGVTRGTERASRILHMVGDKIPWVSGDRLEAAVREASKTASAMAKDKHVLAWALVWASLNWLLDAASLWCFIAAFGSTVNPVELFAAYGIANVAGALPLTPGGLGVVDSAAPLLLVGFGVTRSVATLGVLAWRLVNFWLPIPVGALSYVSLKVKPGQGRAAMETAVAGMLTVVGTRPPGDSSPDTPPAPPSDLAEPRDEPEEGPDRRAG